MTKLAQAKTHVANAQKTPGYPSDMTEWLEADVRFKSAELVSLRKKLEPMESNFEKFQSQQQKESKRKKTASKEPQPPTKKQKTDNSHRAKESLPEQTQAQAQPPLVVEPMMNTATLDVAVPLGGCTLTPDECQYGHIERLRKQYVRPFEMFCREMDSINDTCLTGICLAMPDMPWSIAVSRLAFLTKSMLDSYGTQPTPSETRCLSIGTTVGCQHHVRYIKLTELMVIQDWRDFMRWAHHQSHVFNLCGQPSCIKLRHICLEPVDCLSSRTKCRADLDKLAKDAGLHGQSTDGAHRPCGSPGCWPSCLPWYRNANISHSVVTEYAALNSVSFGPITSSVNKELYQPINEHQLGKLVNDQSIGLIFPFQKSYGHIFVNKQGHGRMVTVDTLQSIPPMYTWEELQDIVHKVPTWAELSFNSLTNSIFWYARRRVAPSLARCSDLRIRFDTWRRYRCPFCYGFDNYLNLRDSPTEMISDFGGFVEALQHMLASHTRVPMIRKLRFLYEETRECPTICDAWKRMLREKYDVSVASLAKGEFPQAIAGLCGYVALAGHMPTEVSKDVAVGRVTAKQINGESGCTRD
ncbi:hypothetical protein EKO27_g11353 [Xylaria grammica]|uniref:Uncharacterized protein n=1 Tax=Xylaria grammica TaxID=363999 RepID=A0A439CNL1_9PEZI|nr:hypothetical protein EKO27_g11353 [Xylaria grammica]